MCGAELIGTLHTTVSNEADAKLYMNTYADELADLVRARTGMDVKLEADENGHVLAVPIEGSRSLGRMPQWALLERIKAADPTKLCMEFVQQEVQSEEGITIELWMHVREKKN